MDSPDEEEWNSSSADSLSQEWPENQDDENDEDFVPESPAAKPRRTRSRRATPTSTIGRPKRLSLVRFNSKSKGTENENEEGPDDAGDEEDGPEDLPESDDDNYVDQEDDDDDDEEESEEEAYTPKRRKPRSPPKRKQPAKKAPKPKPKAKKPKRKPASDSEDDDEDFAEIAATSKRAYKRRSSRRSTAKRRMTPNIQDSDDSEASLSNADDLSPTHGRPSRWSAALATQRLAKMKEKHRKGTDDNDGTMSEIGSISSGSKSSDEQPEILSPSKRNSHLSSDEEFLADSTTDSDERAVFDSDSDSLDQAGASDGEKSNDAVSIDHEQIGSIDGSTDDDAASDNHQDRQVLVDLTKSDTSRHAEIRPTPRNQSSDSSENESQKNGRPRNQGKPRYPFCPSVEDAITLEPLPKRHVCYLSPDGNSRQCFALHTLRQVVLKSAHMPFRVALDGSNQDTFLQPPHFRTAMSDDLLDQIASRFGREALDLHGPFYDRSIRNLDSVEQLDSDEDSDGDDNYVDLELPDETWEEHLNNYISNQMGSKDIYTCPLCYSEIHRQMVQEDKPNEDYTNDNTFLELPADSEYDPMTVLGWLDSDRFDLASEFCFHHLAKVKKHLRDDHHVQTTGIQGNDLYQRYRIRAQDGLLQRYLHNQWRRIQATTFQGAMSIYWRSGHNQSFVYLLDRLNSDEPSDEARDFFDSMQGRAELDWEQVSLPFSRDRARDDLNDFLANDEDEEGDDEGPPFLAHQQLRKLDDEDSDPNDLVHKIQRRYAENEDDDEEADFGDDDPDGSLDDEDYSEEEEEVDDWEQAIVQKRKAKRESPSIARASKNVSPAVGKTLKRRKSTTPSKGLSPSDAVTPSSAAKRRRIIEDNSDDE